ncbi:MAG: CopD family protein [Nitrospira sp.]|nr:CopD family protein [Nitrospira sp.]
MPDYLITWLHLLAAIALIGGLICSRFVLTPIFKHSPPDPAVQRVRRLAGRRLRTIAWVSLIVLILTGAYQVLQESGSARIETVWGVVLMVKLFLFAIAFGLLLIHDFIIDPYGQGADVPQRAHSSRLAPARAGHLQTAGLLVTLAILLVASYLTQV